MSKRLIWGIVFLILSGQFEVGARPADDKASIKFDITEIPSELDFFPVTAQFSPLPSGKGWKGEDGPLSEQLLRDTIDNIIEHGFTGLEYNTGRPGEEADFIINYAQSRGMIITHHIGALEGFNRASPPEPSVYSPEYPIAVRAQAEKRLASLKNIPRLYNVYTYQDEPFHKDTDSFGYSDDVKAEFKDRYGYELPEDLDSIRDNPKKWLDVMNFRSNNFADGWRQVYRAIKEVDPSFKTVLTHDSHNSLGAGCSAGYDSDQKLAIDDVFHWGGDFSDMYVYDIYPYMTLDYRFGEPGKVLKPRMSQTHYTFAQMRNLTYTYGKELGFWVGTYNPAWYSSFMGPELRAMYWSEREMSATAVAQGADFLLTGKKIPVDAAHWKSFGEGLRLIQKAGGRLMKTPKVKAKACMLFPRTQYIQLQEDYYNVGQSFELFLRAFGELDILHEEQVADDTLNGYEILVLFDIKLLPVEVARRITSFVRKGGIVIADCLPQMDSYKQPMTVMEELFGLKDANTDRILRMGHWVPYRSQEAEWMFRPENATDESIYCSDTLKGTALGQEIDLTVVSPRPGTVTTGKVLLKTASGQPGLVHRKVGSGQVFLLCFCVQDTYFKTWQDKNNTARRQLRGLIRAITETAGVRAHVYSSNPDIEASLRANENEGFLFIINHECNEPETTVELFDLDFEIGDIVDMADGKPISFHKKNGLVKLQIEAKFGETQLFHLVSQKTVCARWPANIRLALENARPLKYPRGDRMPLYLWPVMNNLDGLGDHEIELVLQQLDERGLGLCVNWSKGSKDSLEQCLKVGAIQQKLGLRVNVHGSSCLYSFFNGDERTFHVDKDGKKFYDSSFGGRKMGCPFELEFRLSDIKEQVEFFLRGYREKGIDIDFIFADWEIDGPIEWNDAWANSKKCVRCREHIKNIDDFREFQKQLRLIRCDMQRVVFGDNVTGYFPDALVGNYAVYPHNGHRYWYDYFEKHAIEKGVPYIQDQKARYREWFDGFGLTGYTFAMPTVYTWYPIFDWYDFENTDYRWFYNMLLVASNAGENTRKDIPIISFVHWTTTSPPPNPDPNVKQFSERMYRELLWHILLRGHDGLFLWCTKSEFAAEIVPLHEVYAAALQYKDFLNNGEPVSFDVPEKQGSVVSGLKLGNKVLVRRTDFDESSQAVTLRIGGQKLDIPKTDGQCQVLELK